MFGVAVAMRQGLRLTDAPSLGRVGLCRGIPDVDTCERQCYAKVRSRAGQAMGVLDGSQGFQSGWRLRVLIVDPQRWVCVAPQGEGGCRGVAATGDWGLSLGLPDVVSIVQVLLRPEDPSRAP